MSNRRKVPPPPQPAEVAYVLYTDAVHRIAGELADRISYVVSVPPHMLETAAAELAAIPEACWLLDNGTGIVIQASGPLVRILAELLGALEAIAAVAVIPKTVPHARIRRALGEILAADGSQDIVLLGAAEDPHMIWPRLLTAALASIDPVLAAQLAANDIANLS